MLDKSIMLVYLLLQVAYDCSESRNQILCRLSRKYIYISSLEILKGLKVVEHGKLRTNVTIKSCRSGAKNPLTTAVEGRWRCSKYSQGFKNHVAGGSYFSKISPPPFFMRRRQ